MASLLSIMRERAGQSPSTGQGMWLMGLEKADRKGFQAGKDQNAKEADCPYTSVPHRDCWLEAFFRARPDAEQPEPLNKYGVPPAVWATMSERERQPFYFRKWYVGMRSDPRRLARERDKGARVREQLQREWRENPEPFRAKMREYYWRDVELTRAKAREKYHRNLEKERARKHRSAMAKKAKREINRSPEQIFALIDKAVPRALPGFARDEVVSSMCLAVLEGKLLIENISQEARKYLTAYNREFDSFKTASLDAPINGRDGTTFLDLLADETGGDR